MSNQVHLYEIYKYADDEGTRKHNVGFIQASSAEQALEQCASRLNFNVGAEYYVNRIKLVERDQLIEFPKEFMLVQSRTNGTLSIFTIKPRKTELELLREKAEQSGMSFTEMKRFIELAGK